jgi:signal peptidase I
MRRPLHMLRAAAAGLALGVLTLLALALVGPFAVGARPYSVMSGSMEPAIDTGDAVVVKRIAPSDARLGDVVTFPDPRGSGRLLTHRVRGVQRGAVVRFVTKGDANHEVERWKVRSDATIGRVLYRVPQAGRAAHLARSPAGRIALVGIPAVLLGLWTLVRIWRPRGRRFSETRAR